MGSAAGPRSQPVVQAQVEAVDLVAGGQEKRNENGANVAAVAGNEDFHRTPELGPSHYAQCDPQPR